MEGKTTDQTVSSEKTAVDTGVVESDESSTRHHDRSNQDNDQDLADVEKAITSAEKAPAPDEQPPPFVRQITGVKWFVTCLTLYSVNFLYGLDASIAANIQAPVAKTFDEIAKLGWLGIGFMLGSVIFTLPIGKAYAVFDTKWMFIGRATMFAAGSALCGGAPNMNAIIVGRIWAGAGGAGMYLGNINYLAALTGPETPFYMGLIGLTFGTGLILGPVIGGAFADSSATWRWAFYINLVIMGVFSPAYFFLLPSIPRRPKSQTVTDCIQKIDWLGFLLSAAMYTTLVLFITFGGNQWAWSDGRTIACIVVFAIITIVFFLTQYFCIFTTHEDRIFPLEMVGNKVLVALYVCIAASSGALFIILYYIPLYFQFVYDASGVQSAVHLLPTELIFVFATVACGYALPRVGWTFYWFILSGIFLTVGASLMHTVSPMTSVGAIYGFTVLMAIGLTTNQAGYGIGPTSVPPHRIPECIQFLNVGQGQGLLFALTIASAVFQNLSFDQLQGQLEPLGFSETDIRNAIAGADSRVFDDLTGDAKVNALSVIANSIDNVYIMVIAAGAAMIVASFVIPYRRH